MIQLPLVAFAGSKATQMLLPVAREMMKESARRLSGSSLRTTVFQRLRPWYLLVKEAPMG